MVKLGHVSLDSTEIKSNASIHKAMSYGRSKQRQSEFAAVADEWMAEAERVDEEEDRLYGPDGTGDEMSGDGPRIEDFRARLDEARAREDALRAEEQVIVAARATNGVPDVNQAASMTRR